MVVVVEVLVVEVVVGATEDVVLAATLVEDETEISDESLNDPPQETRMTPTAPSVAIFLADLFIATSSFDTTLSTSELVRC
jgi:hypothetical protein